MVGEKYAIIVYLRFIANKKTLRYLNEEDNGKLTLIKRIGVELRQKNNDDASTVTQNIPVSFAISHRKKSDVTVSLNIISKGTFESPQYQIIAHPSELSDNYQYSFYQKVESNESQFEWESILDKSNSNELIDSPKIQTSSLSSYKIFYRVELYKDNTYISSSTYSINESKGDKKEEKTIIEDENKSKIWIPIVISVVAICLIGGIGWGIWRFIIKRKKIVYEKQEDKEIELPNEKDGPKSKRSNMCFIQTEKIKVNHQKGRINEETLPD